ncbi:MAG: phosphoglycerate mutase family protein [Bacilli bacterium]
MKKIILVRHGENIYNSKLKNDDLSLSKVGIEQANKALKIINDDFDIVYCSNSLRTIQTASIINYNNKKTIIDNRLIERGWWNSYNGDEPEEIANQRINLFFKEVSNNYNDKKVLIVSHGSLIKLIQNFLEQNTIERNTVYNCTIIIYEGKNKVIYNI